MKNSRPLILMLCAILGLALNGCGRKDDAQSELDRAASLLEKPTAAPVAEARPTQPLVSPTAPVSNSEQMKQAVAAYKGGNFQDAVRRLQTLRAAPVMSAEQRIAVNDAMASVMREIRAMAEKGDARAIQAVELYKKMQTQ